MTESVPKVAATRDQQINESKMIELALIRLKVFPVLVLDHLTMVFHRRVKKSREKIILKFILKAKIIISQPNVTQKDNRRTFLSGI